MKKLLSVLLVCLLVMAVLPAMADNDRTSGPYTYEIKGNGTITITDFDWSQNEGDIFIPNMIDGYTVTAIGDEAINRRPSSKERISITLPDSITSIGDFAFSYNNLGSINIPESKLELKVAQDEIDRRMASFVPKTKKLSGYLKRYAALVSSGATGAILN